jgi:hypothetical protein
MDSEQNPNSSEAIMARMLEKAFERAAKGEPGRTPEEVMDLIEQRVKKSQENALTPEREAELKGLVEGMGLHFDENTDPAIRHVNGKVAEWELDGTIPPEKHGQRYKDASEGDDTGEQPPGDDDGGTPPAPPQPA